MAPYFLSVNGKFSHLLSERSNFGKRRHTPEKVLTGK